MLFQSIDLQPTLHPFLFQVLYISKKALLVAVFAPIQGQTCCCLASPAPSFCSRGATGQNDCLELLLMDLQQQSFPRQGLCAACAFSVSPTRGTYCSQLKHSPNSANVQQKRLRKQCWFHESRIKITRHCLTRSIRKLCERFDCLQCQQMPATCHGARHSFDTEGTTRGTKN